MTQWFLTAVFTFLKILGRRCSKFQLKMNYSSKILIAFLGLRKERKCVQSIGILQVQMNKDFSSLLIGNKTSVKNLEKT